MDDNNFLNQFSKKDYKPESDSNKPNADGSSNDKKEMGQTVNPFLKNSEQETPLKKEVKGKLEANKTAAEKANLNKRINSQIDAKKTANDQTGQKPFPKIKAGKGSNQKIATTEHIVEKDDHYQKRKMIRNGIIGGSAVAVCLVIYFIFRLINQVEIKDFVGTTIAEAKTWGLTNKITIEVDEVFDLEYDENMIIEQSVEPSQNLQKGSVLSLTVSLGPDPDELIELPDFESMTTSEVNQWRQDLKVEGASVREEYSEEVEKGEFIKKEFASNAVTEANYTRSDGLLIFMSKGVEVFEANIEVRDFTNQPKEEVEKWALDHGIELTFEEGTSSTIPVDFIISQNVAAGEKIARKDEMSVVVSIGQSVTVPNFSNYTAEEAMETFSEELNVLVQRRYHGTVSFGRVISQSESAGTELIKGDTMPRVTVVYSLGPPYIDNLIGSSERELPELFYQFTSQGANITYTINYVDSSESKGSIVSMSKYAQPLAMTDHVNISVSRGNLTPPAPPIDDLPEDIPVDDEQFSEEE